MRLVCSLGPFYIFFIIWNLQRELVHNACNIYMAFCDLYCILYKRLHLDVEWFLYQVSLFLNCWALVFLEPPRPFLYHEILCNVADTEIPWKILFHINCIFAPEANHFLHRHVCFGCDISNFQVWGFDVVTWGKRNHSYQTVYSISFYF